MLRGALTNCSMMIKLLRRIIFLAEAQITAEDAKEIARAECEARGWPWIEPVRVSEGLTQFYVVTNVESRGGNVNIRVSATSGDVIQAAFARR